jgi:hypothetical protein
LSVCKSSILRVCCLLLSTAADLLRLLLLLRRFAFGAMNVLY